MQAADLIGRIAVVMKQCGEDQLMGHLGQVLFEYLGEVSSRVSSLIICLGVVSVGWDWGLGGCRTPCRVCSEATDRDP